jgi:DCN1-like protein 4/5
VPHLRMLWQRIRTDVVVMETATAFWSVLLSPRYAIMGEVIEFINVSFPYSYPEKFKYPCALQEKGTYKGANKDLWGMVRSVRLIC